MADIDSRKPDDKFCIRNGSKYKSIFGIPYIVDDVVVAAIIMTMDEASALDPVVGVREMNDLLERYVHIIGILMVMKSGKEGL